MEDGERSIRNGIFDILCFLSSGRATESQMAEMQKAVEAAVSVINAEERAVA